MMQISNKLRQIIAGIALLPYLSSSPQQLEAQQAPSKLEVIAEEANDARSFENYNAASQSSGYQSHYSEKNIDYLKRFIDSKEDMSQRVQLKWLNILPVSMMGGVLGFTYLGDNSITRREDLIRMKDEVDIHECMHTNDEYETRIISRWMLEKPDMKYKR
ncbi:MAG: hypothetical protein AABX00_00790 [Nanoarchaeota archaeon]